MNSKECATCNKIKSLENFYFHHASGKHEKHCKQCKMKRQKAYYRKPPRVSGVPHEQQLIDKIKSLGLYACSGKASNMTWVDIVVWSVAIEAKLGRNKNGGPSYSFAFTPKQRQQGPRGDILVFIIEPDNSPAQYHLIRSDNPILFHGDGTRKREVYYTPNSTHKNRDEDLMEEMEKAKDNWGLINEIIKEKSIALINGTFQELFLEQTPPATYEPSKHHKDKKVSKPANTSPITPNTTPKPAPNQPVLPLPKKKPAQPIQGWLNSMIQ